MKNLSLSVLILTLLPIGVLGKLAYIPLDKRISNSNLVVIGTLVNLVEREVNFASYGTGTIVIDRVVAGRALNANGNVITSGDELALEYIESFACVMGSHRRIENEKGIFMLTLDDDNKIRYADFASAVSLKEINSLLSKGVQPRITYARIGTLRIEAQSDPVHDEVRSDSELKVAENQLIRYPTRAVLVLLVSVFLFGLLYRNRLKSSFERLWPS